LAAFTRRPGVLIVVTALAFAAAHFDFAPDAFLTRALMGAGFAYMTLRLGGIELSTGAHAANNILILLFIEPRTVKASAGHAVAAGIGLGDLVLVASYLLITEAVVRIAPLRQWAGVRPAEIAPPTLAQRFG
jgi:membrane protease YdiL (CAAX protease family)